MHGFDAVRHLFRGFGEERLVAKTGKVEVFRKGLLTALLGTLNLSVARAFCQPFDTAESRMIGPLLQYLDFQKPAEVPSFRICLNLL